MYPKMSMRQIGEHFGVGMDAIWKRMKKYSITRVQPSREERNNPNWKGGRVKTVCLFCGHEMLVYPGQAKTRKFCSWSCSVAHTRSTGRFSVLPNGLEKTFINLCEKHSLPFHYTGNGGFFVGKLNPDFMHNENLSIAVDIFGDYWHGQKARTPEETESGRKAYFEKYGYDLIVVWERDLKHNPEEVVEIMLERMSKK